LPQPHRKFILHAALTLTLFIAQVVAQTHAYSHLRVGPDSLGAPTSQSSVCADCLMGAPLLSAASAPDSSVVLVTPENGAVVCFHDVSLASRLGHYAFRSRAPPYLV
jgi:hypothetical protein